MALVRLAVLISWGVVGIFQKISTNHISAESLMILLIIGSFAIQPFVLPRQPLSSYSNNAILFGLLSGVLSNLGAWGLFEAMKLGGSASIVTFFAPYTHYLSYFLLRWSCTRASPGSSRSVLPAVLLP